MDGQDIFDVKVGSDAPETTVDAGGDGNGSAEGANGGTEKPEDNPGGTENADKSKETEGGGAAEDTAGAGDSTEEDKAAAAAAAATTATEEVVVDEAAEEDKALEVLRKRMNNPDLTWEDLQTPKVLTPEEVAAAEAQLEVDAIQFGLKNKLFTPTDQAAFAVEQNKSAEDIALFLHAATIRKYNPDATDADIQTSFREEYGLDREANDPYRIRKAEVMAAQKDFYLKDKFKGILGVKDRYKAEQATQQRATQYTTAVDKAISSLTTFTETLKDESGEYPVNVTYNKETLDAIAKEFKTEDAFSRFGTKKPAEIAQMIKEIAIGRDIKKILEVAGNAYHSSKVIKEKATRQGVKQASDTHGSNTERQEATVPDYTDTFLNEAIGPRKATV